MGGTIAASQVDQSASQLMQSSHVTGLGIAIFHRGKVEYLKTYGARDVEKGTLLTVDSVMTSPSLSKAAFATVVMRLVQTHILNLDASIDKYLPKPLPSYSQYADLPESENLPGRELISELPSEDILALLLPVGFASMACCLPCVTPATGIIEAECSDSPD